MIILSYRRENYNRKAVSLGQPKNIGVAIEKNSQTEVGDLIVYKSSFMFTFNGEEFEAVSPLYVAVAVE